MYSYLVHKSEEILELVFATLNIPRQDLYLYLSRVIEQEKLLVNHLKRLDERLEVAWDVTNEDIEDYILHFGLDEEVTAEVLEALALEVFLDSFLNIIRIHENVLDVESKLAT